VAVVPAGGGGGGSSFGPTGAVVSTSPATPSVAISYTPAGSINYPPTSFSTTSLPPATAGVAYSATVVADGAPAPTYAVTGGTLPAGLQLNPNTGEITGTPTLAGPYSVTVTATNVDGSISQVFTGNISAGSEGYWTVGGDGGVSSFDSAFYGSTGNVHLNQPVVGMASTNDGKGYWLVAKDGGAFTYGDAGFHGSVPALNEHVANIVGIAADDATGGYWLVGSDGGVYAFGAPFDGSLPGTKTVSNIVGIAATPDSNGYYLVGSDGVVYPFGDAVNRGNTSLETLNAPIVGIGVDSATGGYWEVGADGGVFSYGAPFHGSAGGIHLNSPIVGISPTTDGSGYYLVASDGGVFAYNAPFHGSTAGGHLNAPIVGITTAE